ncbi:MAG: SMP-30/gluconolactonase/LRE family protein [Nitrososphaerales archaeon]|jgi:virginiamycin B lyase
MRSEIRATSVFQGQTRIKRYFDLRFAIVLAVIAIVLILLGSLAYFFVESNEPIPYTSSPETSQYTTEYPTNLPTTTPNAIAVDAQGNVWFTLENQSSLAELNPTTGKIQEFPIPVHAKGSTTTWGIVVDNTRGLVWFTEQVSNSVWSFSISTHKFVQYELKSPISFPFGIALDEQGNVWFTEFFGNKIGEITTSGVLTEIPIPLEGYIEPSSITVDSTDKVWFTLPGENSTGSYFDGQFSIQNLTGLALIPVGISVDSQGNIWLTQHGPSFISEFNPATHYFKTISTSVPGVFGTSLPYFDYVDLNGNVWFNEHYGNAMAEFVPSNNTLLEYFIPTRITYAGNISGMLTSNLSPSGQPWYTEFFAGKVGTINTDAPLDLQLNLLNYTTPIVLSSNGTTSIQFKISGPLATQAAIKESVGNFSSSFTYGVSQSLAGQVIAIHDNGSKAGVYFVTISALTSSLGVSQIIELEVQ